MFDFEDHCEGCGRYMSLEYHVPSDLELCEDCYLEFDRRLDRPDRR